MEMAERINERFRRDMDRQVDIAKNLARISPAASFRLIAAGLSATGSSETARFWQSLIDYRARLCRFAYDGWAEMALENYERHKAGRGHFNSYYVEDYPRFDYHYADLGDRLEEALTDIVLLCAWCALFFVAGYAVFIREDVT